jgi:MinD-like ATPase involved in chromosome partitioning or flagellar assembly
MTDEQQDAAAEATRRRAVAQSAAGDLARMGIDPRALGLDAPAPTATGTGAQATSPGAAPRQAREQVPQADEHGNVVPIRRSPEARLPASGTSEGWAPAPPPLDPAAFAATEPRSPVERLLSHDSRPPRQSRSPGRLARAVTYGLLTPDAAQAAERERELVARVRTRQSEQRVVVFLAGKGGVGTTTVAVGVGCALAALRDDATTLVSFRAGAPSLAAALTGTRAPTAREFGRDDSSAAPLVLPNALRLVDAPRWSMPVRRREVPMIVDRLGQQSTFLLFDVGSDTGEAAHSLLSRADQVVVVGAPGHDGVEASRLAAERVADVDPFLLDSALYVVVCPREAAHKAVVRRMREEVTHGARVVSVPPETSLAEGRPFDPAAVGPLTRLAMIDVAGLVALGAAGRSGV